MRFRYSAKADGKTEKKATVYTQDEHGIDFSGVDSEAVRIVERLKSAGFETYLVGGAVRDLILGKRPKDFDIVSAANPAKIRKLFRNARIIGQRFRLVHVYVGDKIFEVATFRSLKDGPTSNTFGTVEEDVLRRDFTLNALLYDPLKQVVVDYVGGMRDIRARKIRPIIPLAHIFTDDPVRMIRAVKYGATTGFALPLTLRWKIRRQAGLLADVSPSRLTEEIFKIIHSSQARAIVENLDALGLYRTLQPQAVELFAARPGFRKRYLATMEALSRLPAGGGRPGEALAALVRDYLEDAADWDGRRGPAPEGASPEAAAAPGPAGGQSQSWGPAECFKEAFALARRFVLPMNPPRVELDQAVRLLFAEHGVEIKLTHLPPRGHGRRAGAPGAASGRPKPAAAEGPAPGNAPAPGAEPSPSAPTKRRRRHKRAAAPSAAAASVGR